VFHAISYINFTFFISLVSPRCDLIMRAPIIIIIVIIIIIIIIIII
jgi:hypothetical protein